MTGPDTGKKRAVRIPLDYFKQPDKLQRWKIILTVMALLVVGGIAAASLFRADRGATLASRGPLANVHATWDAECAACHVSFEPMGNRVGISKVIGGAHASDQLCQKCHLGPAHNSRQIASEVGACADCHRDHRGRDVSLVRMNDQDCTRCHANIADHVAPKVEYPTSLFNNVSRFAEGEGAHPPFNVKRVLKDYPNNVKFNHAVHLRPGIYGDADKPKQALWTLEKIADKEERERYRLQQPENLRADDAAVHLNCASCHRLDGGDFGLGVKGLPPRGAGATMLPITYDNQCKACHPLTVPTDLTVPHRQQPAELHQFLRRTLLVDLVKDQPLLDDTFVPSRLKPGESPDVVESKKTLGRLLDERVVTAEKFLYGDNHRCRECHKVEGAEVFKGGSVPKLTIAPTRIPDVWLPHARFSHAAHGALNCASCHAGATTSTESADILIPGIATCIECHAPPTRVNGLVRGGARFDCTECHGYHNGDKPLQGRGAAALFPPRDKQLTIQQFLSGGTKP